MTSARFFGDGGMVGMAPWLLPYMVPTVLGGVVAVPAWSLFFPYPFNMIKYNAKHTALADDQAREDKNNILKGNLLYFVFDYKV